MSFDWKHLLLAVAAAGGIVAAVMQAIPQAAPLAPVVRQVSQAAQQAAERMPDDCAPSTCAFDPRDGKNHVHGPVAFLDGGSCLCR